MGVAVRVLRGVSAAVVTLDFAGSVVEAAGAAVVVPAGETPGMLCASRLVYARSPPSERILTWWGCWRGRR